MDYVNSHESAEMTVARAYAHSDIFGWTSVLAPGNARQVAGEVASQRGLVADYADELKRVAIRVAKGSDIVRRLRSLENADEEGNFERPEKVFEVIHGLEEQGVHGARARNFTIAFDLDTSHFDSDTIGKYRWEEGLTVDEVITHARRAIKVPAEAYLGVDFALWIDYANTAEHSGDPDRCTWESVAAHEEFHARERFIWGSPSHIYKELPAFVHDGETDMGLAIRHDVRSLQKEATGLHKKVRALQEYGAHPQRVSRYQRRHHIRRLFIQGLERVDPTSINAIIDKGVDRTVLAHMISLTDYNILAERLFMLCDNPEMILTPQA